MTSDPRVERLARAREQRANAILMEAVIRGERCARAREQQMESRMLEAATRAERTTREQEQRDRLLRRRLRNLSIVDE